MEDLVQYDDVIHDADTVKHHIYDKYRMYLRNACE